MYLRRASRRALRQVRVDPEVSRLRSGSGGPAEFSCIKQGGGWDGEGGPPAAR